jgi:hypothetical protein
VVYRTNMPMRLLLEVEFRDCGIRFPQHLLETTSAFATLALLSASIRCSASACNARPVLTKPQVVPMIPIASGTLTI